MAYETEIYCLVVLEAIRLEIKVLATMVASEGCDRRICCGLSRWLTDGRLHPLSSQDSLSVCVCVSKFPLFVKTNHIGSRPL